MTSTAASKGNSTINIRIDSALKARGDEVLKQNGISTTAAIRMLWEELAQTHELPEFVVRKQLDGEQAEKQRKLAALDRLCGIAKLSPEEDANLPSYKELRDAMYEDMYQKYLELT